MCDAICYCCGHVIAAMDEADEHIIQNAIGGRLKSRRLLHRSCNNSFGETIDASLAKALNVFMVMFNITRGDHEEPPSHRAETTEGTPVILDANGRIRLGKPEKPKEEWLSDSQIRIQLVAPNMKIARQQLKGLARKYPKLDINKMLASAEPKMSPSPEVNLQISVGAPDHLRAVAKIALGFYLYSGGSIDSIPDVIEYVKNDVGGPFVFPVYGQQILEPQPQDLIHHLEFVANETGVHAYVQLFSLAQFYICLSTIPQLVPLHSSHTFDCLGTIEVERQSSFTIKLKEGANLRELGSSHEWFFKETERILLLRSQRDKATAIDRVCSQAVMAVFEKYQAIGREPTPVELSKEIPKVMKDIILRWAQNAHDARRKLEEEEFLAKTASHRPATT